MLRTALLRRRPDRAALPARRGRRAWRCRSEPRAIAIGTGEILREGGAGEAAGRRVALIGYGSGVGKALAAARSWRASDISVTVVDARFAKPIDAGLMAQLAAEHDLLVTVEEGVLAGGFGSAVWETLNETGRDAAHPARRAARPLRHARQAGAAARGGRLHAGAHRRARARGDLRPTVGDRRGLSAFIDLSIDAFVVLAHGVARSRARGPGAA